MMGIIYRVTNLINGKVYIGQTVQSFNSRIRAHISASEKLDSYSRYFHYAIAKYGWDHFQSEILHRNVPADLLNVFEQIEIANHDSFENGYNLTTGGDSSFQVSAETRRKLSKARVEKQQGEKSPFYGRKHSLKTRERLSEVRRGRSHSLETRLKISRGVKRRNSKKSVGR